MLEGAEPGDPALIGAGSEDQIAGAQVIADCHRIVPLRIPVERQVLEYQHRMARIQLRQQVGQVVDGNRQATIAPRRGHDIAAQRALATRRVDL